MRRTECVESKQLEDLIRKAGGRRVSQLAPKKIRSAPRHSKNEEIRQGDDIEHSESASHSSLAIPERIPREAYARREILFRRIVVVGCANRYCGVCEVAKIRNPAMDFANRCAHFISHAQ